ncbi:ABC transporter, substrate binding protein, possibly Mn [Synechococcus sp. BL107]|uniref:metal ABC transporter substrate-binding protein n=1 Tax=Synechococcus sp. BL107 TaxID=313625 RepID=UPI0000E54644|nr:metal ABC transporter substrate-binding protein [Synechococcus sp. BL107]EAU70772.1 ABC transporter, substrate binding protein, possibly Mn [Synechococcus sp. BL107]
MRRSSWIARGSLTSLLAISLAQIPVQASQPSVVAVDGTLCDLTRTLAATAVSVTCLIPPGGDPHGYRLKPSDRQALSKADLVVHIGFNLTPSAKDISVPAPVVAVGEVALPSYRGNDPHVWHDPANSAAMTSAIANRLSPLLSGDARVAFASRAANAQSVLADLGTWASVQFAKLPANQRVLVTDHQTYSHLANRYDLEEISMLDSYTTGGALKPSSLNAITKAVTDSGARVIFSSYLPANKSLRRISKRSGLPIASTPLYGEGLAPGETAVSTATKNICAILKGQGASCDEAAANVLANRWADI